jgi:hypothetical protein
MSSTSAYLTPPVRPPARASLARASARRPARAACAVLSSSGRPNVRKLQLLLHVDQLAPPNALRVEADNLRRLTVCVAVQCLSFSTYAEPHKHARAHTRVCVHTHAHRASRK